MFLCIQCGAKDSDTEFLGGHQACMECETEDLGFPREMRKPSIPSTEPMIKVDYEYWRREFLEWSWYCTYNHKRKIVGGMGIGSRFNLTFLEARKYYQRHLFNLRQMYYHQYFGN